MTDEVRMEYVAKEDAFRVTRRRTRDGEKWTVLEVVDVPGDFHHTLLGHVRRLGRNLGMDLAWMRAKMLEARENWAASLGSVLLCRSGEARTEADQVRDQLMRIVENSAKTVETAAGIVRAWFPDGSCLDLSSRVAWVQGERRESGGEEAE